MFCGLFWGDDYGGVLWGVLGVTMGMFWGYIYGNVLRGIARTQNSLNKRVASDRLAGKGETSAAVVVCVSLYFPFSLSLSPVFLFYSVILLVLPQKCK